MRHVKTIEDYARTIVYKAARNIYITCEEYKTVWRFTAKICGWELPIAVDWTYKKREHKSYEEAKQAFLSDLAIHTGY